MKKLLVFVLLAAGILPASTIVINPFAIAPAGPFAGHATLADNLENYWPNQATYGSGTVYSEDIISAKDISLGAGMSIEVAGGPDGNDCFEWDGTYTGQGYVLVDNISGGGEYTFAAWFYGPSAGYIGWASFSRTSGGPEAGCHVSKSYFSSLDRAYVGCMGDTSTNGQLGDYTGNTWALIIYRVTVTDQGATYDYSTNRRTYLPGESTIPEVSTAAKTGQTASFNPYVHIGRGYWNAASGQRLGPMMLWSRLLTDTECSDLYNSGTGLFYDQ